MNDFEKEITPGIVNLVAWLQDHRFITTDSGDGISNVQCFMECALETPNVFMDVKKDNAFAEADRLKQLLADRGVELSESHMPSLVMQYDPGIGTVCMYLLGVTDEMMGWKDPDIHRKRLEYQIRYCNNWIDNPPLEKESVEAIAEGKALYLRLRKKFAKKLLTLVKDR